MKKIILITILFISNLAFCQNSDYSKIQLGVNCSPSICDITGLGQNRKFGYISGLNFIYNLSSKLGFETGLQFSNKGYETNYLNFVKYRLQLNYLDLPIKVNFYTVSKRVRLIASTGIVLNIPINYTSITIKKINDELEKSRESYKMSVFNLSVLVSPGIDIQLVDKLNLQIGPDFRYALLDHFRPYKLNAHLWTLGMNVGIYKSF